MRFRDSVFAVVAAGLVFGCAPQTATSGPDQRILVFFDQSGSSRTKEIRVKTTQGIDEVVPFTMDSPITGRSFDGRAYTFAQNIGGGEDMTLDIRSFPNLINEYRKNGLDRPGRESYLTGSCLVPILREMAREHTLKPDARLSAVVVTDGGFTDDRTELSQTLQELRTQSKEPFLLFAGVTFNSSMILSHRQEQRQDARKLLDLRRLLEDAGYRNFALLPAQATSDQRNKVREQFEKYLRESA